MARAARSRSTRWRRSSTGRCRTQKCVRVPDNSGDGGGGGGGDAAAAVVRHLVQLPKHYSANVTLFRGEDALSALRGRTLELKARRWNSELGVDSRRSSGLSGLPPGELHRGLLSSAATCRRRSRSSFSRGAARRRGAG